MPVLTLLVARALNVKVLRFSIGFGRPLVSRTYGAAAKRPGRPWYTSVPAPGTNFLGFNVKQGIFRDLRWRRSAQSC